jgi:hypothetical protein
MACRKYLFDLSIWASQEYFVENKWGELAMSFHETHIAERPLGQPGVMNLKLKVVMVEQKAGNH